MEKREEGCRGRLYKGIAKRSIIIDLWYKVQERAMRRLPRGEEIRVSSAQASWVWFLFLSTIELPLLSSALLFFFLWFCSSPSICMQVDLPNALRSYNLLPFFPTTVG